jgi:hypothetical protein
MITIGKAKHMGSPTTDRRGGDHKEKKFGDKRSSVRAFISKLRVSESHYGRKKSRRVYLPFNYDIKSLFKVYNDTGDENLKVWRLFLRYHFHKNKTITVIAKTKFILVVYR